MMNRGSMFDVQRAMFNVELWTLDVEQFGVPTSGRDERWLKA